MKPIRFEETFVFDAETRLHQTKDGYLIGSPRIARTGVQEYAGREVGRPDLERVRVYRPETEVFNKDSLKSLAHKPVTIEHPDEPLTADNWRNHAVGHLTEEVVRDGEFIRVPLILMDSEAIKEVRGGKPQLSVGYSAVLRWGDGVAPNGEAYDATQTTIRANHVAITHTARGGSQLRMGDSKENRTMKTLMVDGIGVNLEERDLQIVERRIAALEAELATSRTRKTEVATARTEAANAVAQVQAKDAEAATLRQQLADAQLTPEKIDKLVEARAQTLDRAKAIIGDALVAIGKTDAQVRRQVVDSKLGEVAKDWSDDMVTASFNTLNATPTQNNGNDLSGVVNILRNAADSGNDPRAKSYEQYNTDLSNRWKTAGHRTV